MVSSLGLEDVGLTLAFEQQWGELGRSVLTATGNWLFGGELVVGGALGERAVAVEPGATAAMK